jgi:hypothetical protein
MFALISALGVVPTWSAPASADTYPQGGPINQFTGLVAGGFRARAAMQLGTPDGSAALQGRGCRQPPGGERRSRKRQRPEAVGAVLAATGAPDCARPISGGRIRAAPRLLQRGRLGRPHMGGRFGGLNSLDSITWKSPRRGGVRKQELNGDAFAVGGPLSWLCPYVVVSLLTGARTEELRALRWTHIVALEQDTGK